MSLIVLLHFFFGLLIREEIAQQQHGRLIGRVTDASGKPIAAATVFVIGETSRAVSTNDYGIYVFLSAPEGNYKVKVFKEGQIPLLTNEYVYVNPNVVNRYDLIAGDKSTKAAPLPSPEALRHDRKTEESVAKFTQPPAPVSRKPSAKPAILPKPKIAVKQKDTTTVKSRPVAAVSSPSAVPKPATFALSAEDNALEVATLEAENAEKASLKIPDVAPGIVGGLQSVMTQLQYPETAAKLKIEGSVVARVYINERGRITRIDLLKTAHELLDAEAVRVLSESVSYNPAMKDGKPAASALTIPIKFKIAKVAW